MRRPEATREDRDRWGTPQWLFDRLDAVFAFDLDAAAEAHNTKCERFLEDALTDDWTGSRVWMNPPYSATEAFMARAAQAATEGACVVCLVPSRTETSWWHEVVLPSAREVAFFRNRIAFEPPPGLVLSARGNRPVFASALVVFGQGPSLQEADLSPRRNSALLVAGQRELPIHSIEVA